MEYVIQGLGLILSLSILVVLHEMGHFVFARIFKTRVEKFYLFFNPWFSLFKKKIGDTEYGIGWLPLGGYVKISGMIDESMDKEQLKQEPQPWEFRSKPAWQRLFIMIGGVLVNFILALIIYSMILFTWGSDYLPVKNATWGYHFNDVAKGFGFQNGDKIILADGKEIEEISDLSRNILLGNVKSVEIERNGHRSIVNIPHDGTKKILASGEKFYLEPRFPFVVEKIIAGNPAAKAGMQAGDSIVSINGIPFGMYTDFADKLKPYASKKTRLGFYRNGQYFEKELIPTEDAKVGIQPKSPVHFFDVKHIEYGFFESIPAGISQGFETLGGYVKSLKLVFSKEGAKQVGGFGTIGGLFPKVWDWQIFWNMTALLSVILAFMNILPIPALDGGHVLFLLFEMITGRKPSDKFLEYAQVIGMVILFSLLIFANGNDFLKLFK